MTTQNEIMKLERQFWQSMVDMDVDVAMSLLDDISTTASARGIHYFNPAEYKKMALSGDVRITSFNLSEEKVIFPTSDVAIASYKANQSFTIGGEKHEMVVYDTTTWTKKNGRWLACAHTEIPEQKDTSASA